MLYELIFREDAPEQDAALARKYWAIENGLFVHNTNELAATHNLTRPQLTTLVKGITICKVSLGHCAGCGDELLAVVSSKSHFQDLAQLMGDATRCPDCQRAYEKRQRYETECLSNQAVSALGRNARRFKQWEYLTDEELVVLKGMVRYKLKHPIYEHVFKGNPRNPNVWAIVKRLVKRRLVEVVRSYQHDFIEGFDFPSGLEKELFPDGLDEEVGESLHELNAKLLRNPHKIELWQPDFTGTLTLLADVSFAKGSKLAYALWQTNTKDLLFQLLPFEAVQPALQAGRLADEPLTIQQILERYYGMH